MFFTPTSKMSQGINGVIVALISVLVLGLFSLYSYGRNCCYPHFRNNTDG